MKKKFLFAGGFIIVFAVGMILNMPSLQLLRWVKMPAIVELQGLGGSVASGQIAKLQIGKVQLQGIEYRIQPSCLIFFSICYQINSEVDQLHANFGVSVFNQSLMVTDTRFQADASLLENMPGLLLKPAGTFDMSLAELSILKGKIASASGRIDWEQAGIQGDSTVFGNYRIDIDLSENAAFLVSSSESNSLTINGDISLNRTGGYDIDLSFSSSPNLQGSVKSLLEASLEQTNLDQYRLRKKGQVSHPLLKFL